MSAVIWKFPMPGEPSGYVHTINMPIGAEIIAAQRQDDVLCLWAVVDQEALCEDRRFTVLGTGHLFDPTGMRHIATWQDAGFVWHLFEVAR